MVAKTIAHYEVLGEIGAGGMGVVFEAWDTRLERRAAIKALPEELAQDPQRLARLEREAKLLAGLKSPYIATVYGLEEIEGRRFLAMELVEGESLAQRLAKGPLPVKEALELARQVAAALEEAHSAGVIHRDVKPGNIMIDQAGKAKVLDFGLAKVLRTDTPESDSDHSSTLTQPMTRAGQILGTPVYMSPEQARGGEAGRQSDIWAFGCVLYEMLAGKRPFPSPSLGSAGLEPDWEALPAAMPPGCRRLVRRCLQNSPRDRFRDIGDIRILLEDVLSHISIAAVPGEALRSALPPQRMPRWALWSGIAAATVVVAALVSGTVWVLRPEPDQGVSGMSRATFRKLVFDTAVHGRVTISPDGRFFAYASNALGNWDIYLRRIEGGRPINLTGDSPEDDRQPAFSPDGEQIAFRSERSGGGIFVMGATGETVRRFTDQGFFPSWSPDGTRIVYSTSPTAEWSSRDRLHRSWIVDIDSGERRQLLESSALSPVWSPAGWRIAYRAEWEPSEGAKQRDIFTAAPDGGTPVRVTDDGSMEYSPAWSSDGRSLFFVSDRGGTRDLWRASIDEKSGRILGDPQPMTSGAHVLYAAPSGDGRRILYTVSRPYREILRLRFDPVARQVVGPAHAVTPPGLLASGPAVSADGEWIAFHAEFGQPGRHALGMVRRDGSELQQITDLGRREFYPDWSPDGQRLAFHTSNPGMPYQGWIVNSDGAALRLLTDVAGIQASSLRWSPDGARLSMWNPVDRRAYISGVEKPWSEEPPSQLPPVGDGGDGFLPLAWSPDGRQLAGAVVRARAEGGDENRIAVYSFDSRSYRILTDPFLASTSGGSFPNPQWLEDARTLFFWRPNGSFSLLDTKTGEENVAFSIESLGLRQDGRAGWTTISRDGRNVYLTWSYDESSIWMLTLEGE